MALLTSAQADIEGVVLYTDAQLSLAHL